MVVCYAQSHSHRPGGLACLLVHGAVPLLMMLLVVLLRCSWCCSAAHGAALCQAQSLAWLAPPLVHAGYYVVLPDMPGFGHTPPRPGGRIGTRSEQACDRLTLHPPPSSSSSCPPPFSEQACDRLTLRPRPHLHPHSSPSPSASLSGVRCGRRGGHRRGFAALPQRHAVHADRVRLGRWHRACYGRLPQAPPPPHKHRTYASRIRQ
jgi:hypothetical protein